MDIYESKKEEFRQRFEKMSDLSVREFCCGRLRICIFYISNFCSKNMIAEQIINPLSAAYGREFPLERNLPIFYGVCRRNREVYRFTNAKIG